MYTRQKVRADGAKTLLLEALLRESVENEKKAAVIAKNSELNHDVMRLKSKTLTLESQVEELEVELSDCRCALDRVKTDNKALREKLGDITAADSVKGKLKKAYSDIAALTQELAINQHSMKKNARKMARLTQQNQSLHDKMDGLKAQFKQCHRANSIYLALLRAFQEKEKSADEENNKSEDEEKKETENAGAGTVDCVAIERRGTDNKLGINPGECRLM